MPDNSLYPPQIITLRPSVVILGEPEVDLLLDITSIRFTENRRRCKSLEVSVNNWDGASIDYKYSGGAQGNDLAHIGADIKFCCGSYTLALGKIASLAPDFGHGGPPTLTFSVNAHHAPRKAPSDVFTIAYGAELSEFHPVLYSDRSRIRAFGIADGSPLFIAGIKLTISAIGKIFNGTYSVTETIHTFNKEHGYRISFTCVKPVPQGT